jgi:hypothetical protein
MSCCSNCDFEFSVSSTSYEVSNGLWCEECYTKINYPDVYQEEQSKKEWVERCEKDDCDCCSTPTDELNELDCGHKFCYDCFTDIEKFNKCAECYEVIDDEKEPNKEVCGSCCREMCDCICYYNKPIDKEELLYTSIFITFKSKVHHKVLRKIIELFDSKYGYKDFHPEYQKTTDIIIDTDNNDSNYYVVSVPNIRYDAKKPDVASNQQFSKVVIEFQTEEDLDNRTLEYVKEHLCYFNKTILFHNLKPDIYKEVIEYDSEEEEPEKVYENDNCPICLECYDDNDIIKKVGCCGHMCCNGCYNHIINSNNSRCPTCREVWDDATNETEYIEWEQDDINELCEGEDIDLLNEIIDVNGVKDDVINYDGYSQTLGFEECEYYDINNVKYRGENNEVGYVLVGDY